jgi:hypothetical protein
MQLPEKYKKNFDVSSEGPSSGVSEARENYMNFYAKNISRDPDEGPSLETS